MKTKSWILLLFILQSLSLLGEGFSPPLRLKPVLSANFGELRNNHFHAGLDYKTQYRLNQPVYAIADGYISRISVSPSGYGLALYIDHPNGYTSVYGHLNDFIPQVAQYVKKKQYQLESYKVNLFPKPTDFPIKKGMKIALSGNTGGSGGAHLHFEIRDTKTENPIDPLIFLIDRRYDTMPPQLRSIALYPQPNRGIANNSTRPTYLATPLKKNITAWGKIGLGLKAYDKMNNTHNVYGVKEIELLVDGQTIYHSTMNRFDYERTRMLNSYIDFEKWRKASTFYMKSYIEPGNQLQMYDTIAAQAGILDIVEERDYHCRYILKDHFGNQSNYQFVIKGKRQIIPQHKCQYPMHWDTPNEYHTKKCSIIIPSGNLYTDICFHHQSVPTSDYYSALHRIHTVPVPLHRGATIWLAFATQYDLKKHNFGILRIDHKGKSHWVGGTYRAGGIEATISELGEQYAIGVDDVKPIIKPLKAKEWVKKRKIQILLKDTRSGIKSFRATIDSQFVLFEYDMKSDIYTYEFDNDRLGRNQSHRLQFVATDNAGNVATYTYRFFY